MFSRIIILCFISIISSNNCKLDSIAYINKIEKMLTEYEIQDSVMDEIKFESCNLVIIGKNIYGYSVKLDSTAANAFFKMKDSAKKDSIEFRIVSAFRSFDYQKNIINRKLSKGRSIGSILKENTLPGFSEHHTGYAVDFVSKNSNSLSTNFESTDEFKWLINNANRFGFYLSYPKNNESGIMYEPWHWCFRE